MQCQRCGNMTNFIMVREIADWDNDKKLWIENRLDDEIMCNECNSFDVQEQEWEFE
jgi:hypothetical protein